MRAFFIPAQNIYFLSPDRKPQNIQGDFHIILAGAKYKSLLALANYLRRVKQSYKVHPVP